MAKMLICCRTQLWHMHRIDSKIRCDCQCSRRKRNIIFYLDIVTYAGGHDGNIAYRRKLGYGKHEILACTTAAKRRKII